MDAALEGEMVFASEFSVQVMAPNPKRGSTSIGISLLPAAPASESRRMAIVASLLWLFGGAQIVLFAAAIDDLTVRPLVTAFVAVSGGLICLVLPWSRVNKLWWHIPIAAGSAYPLVWMTSDYKSISMLMFIFALGFGVYFFWEKRAQVVGQIIFNMVCYTYGASVLDGQVRESFLSGLAPYPIILGVTLTLGATGHHMRRLREQEQHRHRSTVEALAGAIEARDGYTGEHSAETLVLVEAVAEELGLEETERIYVAEVALLHDIGKIGIPNDVLHAPGRLNDEQWEVMRQHPVVGERIVERVSGMEDVAKAIRHEHEHWNGGGYPDSLRGQEIPLASRIVLCCDAFHAMTSNRPYRKAMAFESARAELLRCAGSQFDPTVVEAFLRALDKGDIDFMRDRGGWLRPGSFESRASEWSDLERANGGVVEFSDSPVVRVNGD